MTRILRIITSADPRTGGPIEGARQVGEIWSRAGHQQDLLTLDPPDEHHLHDYPGTIVALGPSRGTRLAERYRYSPAMLPWLAAHLRDYDAVIVSGLWRYAARGAMRALAGSDIPYVVFPHGMLDPWFRRTAPLKHLGKQASWWWAEGRLLAGARHVLFTSEEERCRARGAFWPYRVNGTVVAYGTPRPSHSDASAAAFRALFPSLGDCRYLLYLGRLHPKKGCDLLVEAFGKIAPHHPDLDLVLAGPDQTRLGSSLQETAQKLGLSDRIHFPGMIEGEAKAGALRAAEAFILPSHQENFGIAVAEALAHGTPVLISDQVNIWRKVLAEGAGLVAPDTLAGTTDLLTRFLGLSPEERNEMRRKALHCFAHRFDLEHAAAELMTLLRREIR